MFAELENEGAEEEEEEGEDRRNEIENNKKKTLDRGKQLDIFKMTADKNTNIKLFIFSINYIAACIEYVTYLLLLGVKELICAVLRRRDSEIDNALHKMFSVVEGDMELGLDGNQVN